MLKKEFWFVIVLLLAVSFLSVAAGSESQQKFYCIEVPVLFHEHEQSKVEALGALQEAQTITTGENSLQFDSALNNRLQFDAVTDNKTGDAALAEDQYRYYGHFDYTGKVGTTRAIQRIDLFQPFLRTDERLMFFDVRVGNDSHKNYEYNLGLGFREMASNRLINGFYAYLDGKRSPNRNLFHNITTGYELLFSAFEARINAYIPIGRRSYKLKEITHFYNHYFAVERKTVFQQTHHTIYEKSFGGFDIEAGGTLPYLSQASLYATYYRFMASGMDAIDGVRVRGTWEINKYFSMEASADFGKKNNHAKYIGFKITIPFGEPPEKPSALERKMVSLPTRDIDIVSDEGQDSEMVGSEINDGLVPLLIGTELEDDDVKKDEKGTIVAAAASENRPVQTHYDGNAVFHGHHATEQHQAKYDALGHNGEMAQTLHHASGKGKQPAVKHTIDSLENFYSSDDSDYDSDIEYDSDNSSISGEPPSSLSPDLSWDSSSSSSGSQSFSSDSSSFHSSSFTRRQESPKHRVRRYISIFKKRPGEVKPPENPNPSPDKSITSTSTSSSNTDSYIQTLQSSITDLKTKLDNTQKEKEDLESQLTTLRGELSRKDNELSTLTTNNNSLNNKLEADREKLTTVESELQNATDEVTQLTESLAQSNTAKEAAEGQVQQQLEDLKTKDKRIKEIEESLEAKTNKFQSLQENLTTTQQQVEGLEVNNNNLTDANRTLMGENKEQVAELDKLREDLAAEQTKSNRLAGDIQERDKTIQEQTIQQGKSTKEINRLQAENDQLQADVAGKDAANTRADKLQRDNGLLQQQLTTTKEQPQAQMDSNETLRTNANNQQTENQKLQLKLEEARQKPTIVDAETQVEEKVLVSTATQTEVKMAITTKMGSKKPLDPIRVTDRTGKKTIKVTYDPEKEKYVVSLENHTTTSLIIDKDTMETFRKQYKQLNLEQQGELFRQAYSYLMNADRPSLRFETNKPLVHKGQQLPENQQQIITSRSKSRLLALPATNTQPRPQDSGREGDVNFGYDSNSKEIYYKGIRVFFKDNKEGQRYQYVGNLGDSSPFSSEQKRAIKEISRKKHKNQIQDVQKALQELANPAPLVTAENGPTTPIDMPTKTFIETKTIKDGDQHHYITGDLAISRKLRNQDNTIKAIPLNTINTSRVFSQDDLSLPKLQLQINEKNLKNALKEAIRTKSMPDLSIPEASVEEQISSTKSSSVAETPAISKANSDVDLLNHSTGDSTALALCSPSFSGLLTRSTSKENLGSPVQKTLKRTSAMQPVRKKDGGVNLRRQNSVGGNSVNQRSATLPTGSTTTTSILRNMEELFKQKNTTIKIIHATSSGKDLLVCEDNMNIHLFKKTYRRYYATEKLLEIYPGINKSFGYGFKKAAAKLSKETRFIVTVDQSKKGCSKEYTYKPS